MRGVHNSRVVVQRRIEFFYYFSFYAVGDLLFSTAKKVSKKCRPQTPGGYTAQIVCMQTQKKVAFRVWMDNGRPLRNGLTRCA